MMKPAILILLVLATAAQSLASKEASIIDEHHDFDVEKVAEVVCDVTKGSGKQIGRAATVGKLAEFFKTLPNEHKLARCRDQFGESVERLQQVLETGNGNVCGNDKIRAVEQFHRRYVSGVRKYKKEQEANKWTAPKLIKIVFMQYASKISSICEKSAAQELAQVAEKIAAETPSEIDQVMGQIGEVAGISDLSKGYDSVFSLWSLLDKLPVEESDKFSRYVSSESQRKLTIAVQQAARLRQIQEQCAQVMRPIYARSLLGVLRLVDMGYYPEDELLIKEARDTPASKRLIVSAQLCELLLPIKVVEDATLAPEQIVMQPKDEQKSDEIMLDRIGDYPDVPENSLGSLDLADKSTARSLAKALKRSVRRRDGATKLIFKSIIDCFKSKIKSKVHSLLMANGGAKEQAIEEDLLASVDEKDLSSLVEEETESVGSNRRKRGIGMAFARVATALGYLVFAAFTFVLSVIYFALHVTIMYGLHVIYKFFYYLTGYKIKWIRYMERGFNIPIMYAMDKYKEKIAYNED